METPSPPPAAPHPTQARRGCGFWLAVLLAAGFFCTSGLLALVVFGLLAARGAGVAGVMPDAKAPYHEMVVKGRGPNKILMLPVHGLITNEPTKRYLHRGRSMVDSFKAMLDQAEKDDKIKAVLIEVDSPGGGITASDILCKRLVDFKKKSKAKVVVMMQDVAASGGYYISAPADRILAHPTTITGSIGVIMPYVSLADLIQRWGIKPDHVKSGKMKDMGSLLRDMEPEERQILQGIIDEMHDRFVTTVATHRGMPKEKVAELADGRVYTGEMAKKVGLVDEVGYLDDAIQSAMKLAGIQEAKIIRYRREMGLVEFLETVADMASTPRRVEFSLGATPWPAAGRPQYLWMAGLPVGQSATASRNDWADD